MCLFKMVGSDFIVTPSGKDLCNQKVLVENSLQFQLELLYPEGKKMTTTLWETGQLA